MTQALYAHMNNKTIKIKKKISMSKSYKLEDKFKQKVIQILQNEIFEIQNVIMMK
jgi:hypothetical protein